MVSSKWKNKIGLSIIFCVFSIVAGVAFAAIAAAATRGYALFLVFNKLFYNQRNANNQNCADKKRSPIFS